MAGAFAALAAVALGLWIPADTGTGLTETFRRQTTIGDALAPAAAAACMLAAALALGCSAALRPPPGGGAFDAGAVRFALQAAAVVAAGLVLMVHAGPLAVAAVDALGGETGGYRRLRDTPPYKYIGYLAGGSVMVAGLIAVIEQRVSAAAVAVAAAAAAALAAFYDIPFDDLLLPPNGDQ